MIVIICSNILYFHIEYKTNSILVSLTTHFLLWYEYSIIVICFLSNTILDDIRAVSPLVSIHRLSTSKLKDNWTTELQPGTKLLLVI